MTIGDFNYTFDKTKEDIDVLFRGISEVKGSALVVVMHPNTLLELCLVEDRFNDLEAIGVIRVSDYMPHNQMYLLEGSDE